MKTRKRFYDTLLADHLGKHRQMALVSGPRQVGKTTTCQGHSQWYANWDNIDDRERILAGPERIVEEFGLVGQVFAFWASGQVVICGKIR